MQRLFWACELILMATPAMFPTIPPVLAWLLYAVAIALLIMAAIDWARNNGWQSVGRFPLSLGRFSPSRSMFMSLIELRSEASRYGWDFSARPLEILDLLHALSEAGHLGLMTFYGRAKRGYLQEDVARTAIEWRNGMEVGPDGIMDLDCSDNSKTHVIGNDRATAFTDIYVKRDQVKGWLGKEAAFARGRTGARRQ